jgi:hypothetical protein
MQGKIRLLTPYFVPKLELCSKPLIKCCIKKRFSDVMSKLRVSLVIFVDVLLFIALILIYQIDQLVNGTLYYYGLIFDYGWYLQYTLLSRIGVVGIAVAMFLLSSVELPISAFKEKS